jgi:hypothetical protein
MYSDASYDYATQVAEIPLSGIQSGTVSNDVTTYPAINWEVELAPSSTEKTYYAELYYSTSSGSGEKELGEFFKAGKTNVTGLSKTADIGVITMTGTLSVTVNGTALVFDNNFSGEWSVFPDDKYSYTNQIGYTTNIGTGGAWKMLIPDTYKTVYFMLQVRGDDESVSYKLGGKPVTTETTALTGTFTTKDITGTVKNGTNAIQGIYLTLVSDTAATIEAFLAKYESGTIAIITQASSDKDGKWTVTVLSDVASVYILVAVESDYYITKDKVTLEAGKAIALDIETMNYLGEYNGN